MTFDSQPTLCGELLELRPMQASDFEALYAVAADPLIWEQHPNPERSQREVFGIFFRSGLESRGALVARDRHSGRVIGTSRFCNAGADGGEIEIGYTFLARNCWGRGYNGEMKRLMLAHAFEHYRSVALIIGLKNYRSQRAAEKIGAVRIGTRIQPDGAERVVYRISAPADSGSVQLHPDGRMVT